MERREEDQLSSEKASWFSALGYSWRSALRIDRMQVTAAQALSSVIGFALPLALGVATGHVVEGVSMAGGAATLGAVGLTYTYRARTRTLLLACLGIAFSAFVGSITSRIDWLAILVACLWGFGAGLLVALGQSAMVVGLQAAVALIVLSHFALDPLHALLQAALMLAGALFQTLLAILPFPWRHTAPERVALVVLYSRLADYAAQSPDEQDGHAVRDALLKAHTVLSDSGIRGQQKDLFLHLLEEAERIRLSFILLKRLRQHAQEEQATAIGANLDALLQAAAAGLRDTANEMKLTAPLVHHVKPREQFKEQLSELRQQGSDAHNRELITQGVAYGEALFKQLQRARKLAKAWKYRQYTLSIRLALPRPSQLHLYNTATTLRANLNLRSTTFRHAIRLGVALALTTALYRVIPLPVQRGYWMPLTALLVLRPDFSSTFTRGIARFLGTLLGAVLVTLLVVAVNPSQWLLVVLDAAMAYLAFSVLFVNYALFSALITVEVVLLLTFVVPQSLQTAEYRAIDTTIGGILALLIYVVWPSWERSKAADDVVKRLEALRHYLVAVFEAYAHPGGYDDAKFLSLRMELRLARSNAQVSVERARYEPIKHRLDPELAQGILEAADGMAQSGLALEAYLVDNPAREGLPGVSGFAATIDEGLHLLVTAIRDETRISTFPDLQDALHKLKHATRSVGYGQSAEKERVQFVLDEVKRMVRILGEMRELVGSSRHARMPVLTK
jgi:uncharacterized membrane protein YccC